MIDSTKNVRTNFGAVVQDYIRNLAGLMGIRKPCVKISKPRDRDGKGTGQGGDKFDRNLKVPVINKVKVGAPKNDKGNSRKPRTGVGKGLDKSPEKSDRKPNRKYGKPTRGGSGDGGGGGGGGGGDSDDGIHERGCYRCGEPHSIREYTFTIADSREAFKIYLALKSDPSHKPNASKAAETDPGSESEDDGPEEGEGRKDIGFALTCSEFALTCAEVRKSMASLGRSHKAINRKIKLFEMGMYAK